MKALKLKSPTLGARLRLLRKQKGVKSPGDLSERMRGRYGVSGILRREEGRLKIDEKYLGAFAEALGLSSDELSMLQTQFRISKHKADQSWEDIEKEYSFITKSSQCIYNYRSATLPTELQTLEYAYAVASALDKGDYKERVKRGRELKSELSQKKEVKIICPEWTLYIPYGSPRIMLDQMVALREYTDRAPIEFRVLPWDVFPSIPVGRGYKIYDHNYCRSASRLEVTTVEGGARVPEVEKEFLGLWDLSVTGEGRARIIDKAIEHYRGMVRGMLG